MPNDVLFLYGYSRKEAEAFSHEKVVLLPEDPHEEILKRIAWETLFNSSRFAFSPNLTVEEQEHGSRIIQRFEHLQRGAHAVIADVRDMGKKIIGNIVRNLNLLPGSSDFSPFKGAFKNVPALICGAGPSLEKGLPYLPGLRERALVLAGGSALNALTQVSFFPHFSAALDPDPPAHLFRSQGAVESPLFYQNRVAHRLLDGCHGPRIFVPDTISYPIESWFLDRLGIEALPFEAGWNVATFCLHIAVAMGCNPIIITGVDLSHPQGKAYATGVAMPQTSTQLTKSDFLLAADWIEEFVAAHPTTTFINASTGGMPLRGLQQKTLQELDLPLLSCDVEGKIISLLSASSLPSREKVALVQQEFKENLETSHLLLERMVAILQKWYPEDASAKGEYILPEVELEENPVYTHFLEPMWNVWQWVLSPPGKDDAYANRLQKLLFFQKALQELL